VIKKSGAPDLLDLLTERLSGSDLTTLLLEVMRRRVSGRTAADLLRAYQQDRFVAPGPVPFVRLRHAEDALLATLPTDFETTVLAPVVSLGTHSVLAPVDQNRVISTIRQTEVAADPTNGLALEAALRRRELLTNDPRSAQRVKLAASQRVARGQLFEDADAFAHFQLFGLVTAGRDEGSLAFERDTAAEHIRFAASALLRAGVEQVRVELTVLPPAESAPISETVRDALADLPKTEVIDKPDRTEARGYYTSFCFKARSVGPGGTFEIADGGLVDWTQTLVQSRKERLFISGLGVERLAMAMDPRFRPTPGGS
jgi:hypothetical protein